MTVWPRPGAEGNASIGVSELRWILDGRWIRQDYRAANAEVGGATGLGLLGYDNVQNEHVFFWTDNMSCSPLHAVGHCDYGGREILLAGTHSDPLSGDRHRRFRWVIRELEGDRWTLELYDAGDGGKEFRKIEILNTRLTS